MDDVVDGFAIFGPGGTSALPNPHLRFHFPDFIA